jgi:hypothetical protein
MAHDAFLFRDSASDIRSDFLGSVLRRWESYANGRSGADPWFASALARWRELYDRMPSGFRSIDLDEWLTDETRCAEFLSAIDWVRADTLKSIEAGDFNAAGLPFEATFEALKSLVATQKP